MTNTVLNSIANQIALMPINGIEFKIPKGLTDYSYQVAEGNTGNGTMTLLIPGYTQNAPKGIYKVKITDATTQAFTVYKPDGTVDGTGTVGLSYDGSVKFLLSDGTTDFVLNDLFYLMLTNGEYLVLHNLEVESSFSITPKTRTNDKGQNITVGNMIEGYFYFPYNLFASNGLIEKFENDLAIDYEMSILFGDAKSEAPVLYTEPKYINTTGNFKLTIPTATVMHNFTIEYVELRPRIKVSITGYIKNFEQLTLTNYI